MKVIKIVFAAIVLVLSLLFYKFLFSPEEIMTIGIIDRIEDAETAVVLIEAERKQIELNLEGFPEVPKEGDVLYLQFKEEDYEVIRIDNELSKERKEQVNKILQQLQNKN